MKNKIFTFFWHGPFSQWHMSDFYGNDFQHRDIKYCCAEQYMMAKKAELFKDEDTLMKIYSSKNPKEIKDLGREIKNFNQDVWNKNKFGIVYEGNFLKFGQDFNIQQMLLDTGDTLLVEASPYDKVWGIGLDESNPDALDMNKWKGENLLGKILTAVRDYYRYHNTHHNLYGKDDM